MNKSSVYSDACLLAQLKLHSFEAFEEIYQRYWKQLYSISFKGIRSREIAEEIVQDIFTSLWEKKDVNCIENLAAYLQTAAKYKVINHIHREMTKRVYMKTFQEAPKQYANPTEDLVLLDDLNDALEREIKKLPEKRQLIFKLHRQQHLSMKQVASQLGISEKTVENQLSKAVKVLRLSLRHFLILIVTVGLERLLD
jgi:RNA polymerase sigma-70 factor (ECF subfamily)